MLTCLLLSLATKTTPIKATLDLKVRVVDRPDTGENAYYVGNRAPLSPSYFRKLPIGAIRPMGWVRTQLRREADGFIGHLTEISDFLKKPNNAWLSPTGEGEHGCTDQRRRWLSHWIIRW